MADKYINEVGLLAIKNWILGKFALDSDLDALDAKVDEIIAEGGEPNTIESISVNGTGVTPDAQKNVALTVPVTTSDLTNDGDGTSNFATESYVDTNGGKIDSISVNGTAQTIDTNKNVDLSVQEFSIIDENVTTFEELIDIQEAGKPIYLRTGGTTKDYRPIIKLVRSAREDVFLITEASEAGDNTVAGTTFKVDRNDDWSTSIYHFEVPTSTSQLTNDSNYQTDTQVDAKIATAVASAVTIKGSVATASALPATGNKNGDMYDVLDTGRNYVWIEENGTGRWDDYAGTIDMSAYWTSTSGQTNSLVAMTNTEVMAILEPSA